MLMLEEIKMTCSGTAAGQLRDSAGHLRDTLSRATSSSKAQAQDSAGHLQDTLSCVTSSRKTRAGQLTPFGLYNNINESGMGVGWGKLPSPALYATSLPKACVDTWRCKPLPLRTDHNECNRLDAVSPEGKSKKLRFLFPSGALFTN